MEITITNGNAVERWESLETLQPGEFVAPHLIPKRREGGERAIFVGREPWGRRGAKSGEAIDGRIVARTDDLSDPDFNVLLFELFQNAVNANPPDSPIVEMSCMAALRLKDYGFRSGETRVFCPKCGQSAERLEASERFGSKARFLWFTKPDKTSPRKMSTGACVFCLKAVVKTLVDQRDKAKKARSREVDDLIFEGATIDCYLPVSAFDDAIGRVKHQIELISGR